MTLVTSEAKDSFWRLGNVQYMCNACVNFSFNVHAESGNALFLLAYEKESEMEGVQ